MKLYYDNKSKIDVAHNPILQDKIKHIEIDGHFTNGKLDEGLVCMSYISSQQQVADVITKGLNSSSFHNLISKLGMEDIYSSA